MPCPHQSGRPRHAPGQSPGADAGVMGRGGWRQTWALWGTPPGDEWRQELSPSPLRNPMILIERRRMSRKQKTASAGLAQPTWDQRGCVLTLAFLSVWSMLQLEEVVRSLKP